LALVFFFAGESMRIILTVCEVTVQVGGKTLAGTFRGPR
jgi:hypothetical protein